MVNHQQMFSDLDQKGRLSGQLACDCPHSCLALWTWLQLALRCVKDAVALTCNGRELTGSHRHCRGWLRSHSGTIGSLNSVQLSSILNTSALVSGVVMQDRFIQL